MRTKRILRASRVTMGPGAKIKEQIQDALDAGERREWHLVGVSVLPEHAVILFRDTARPGFSRTSC